MLRREPPNMAKWAGYHYYFQKALTKLSPFCGYVFRGVGKEDPKYSESNTIIWSGYTSASENMETVEKRFTENGYIFKIKISDNLGRKVGKYTRFPENEVILPPFSKFIYVKQEVIRQFTLLHLRHIKGTFLF